MATYNPFYSEQYILDGQTHKQAKEDSGTQGAIDQLRTMCGKAHRDYSRSGPNGKAQRRGGQDTQKMRRQ